MSSNKLKLGDLVIFYEVLGPSNTKILPGSIGIVVTIDNHGKAMEPDDYPIEVRFFDGEKESFKRRELRKVKKK